MPQEFGRLLQDENETED